MNFLKSMIKVLLLVVGVLMLFGGGICVLIDVVGFVTSSTNASLVLSMAGIAMVVALIGWVFIRLSKVIENSSSNDPQSLNKIIDQEFKK